MVTYDINELLPPGYPFIACLSKQPENLSEVKSLPSPHSRVPCPAGQPASDLISSLTLQTRTAHLTVPHGAHTVPRAFALAIHWPGWKFSQQAFSYHSFKEALNFQQILPVFLFIHFKTIFILCNECFTCMYKCAPCIWSWCPQRSEEHVRSFLELEFRMIVSTPQDARN